MHVTGYDAPNANSVELICELTRRLDLPYTRTFVQSRIVGHRAPRSLLALVEVSEQLGIALTPVRCVLEELDELDGEELPVVLHFDAEQSGFGLLVRVDGDRYHVWTPRQRTRTLNRHELAVAWSGITMFIGQTGEPGIREPKRWRRRLAELVFFDSRLSIELTGPRSSPLVGLVLITALLGLIALGVANAGRSRLLVAGLGGLSLAGMVAMFAMARVGREASVWGVLCGAGGARNCRHVLTSPYARVAGIPLASIGFAFFGTTGFALGVAALAGPSRTLALIWLVGAMWLAALPVSLLFTYVQLAARQVCGLCMSAHAFVGAGSAAIAAALIREDLAPPTLDAVVATALFMLLVFGVLLAVVAPQLANADELETVQGRLSRLTAMPRVTLAELLLSEPVIATGSLGVEIGDPSAPLHVLAVVHPRCSMCSPVLAELQGLLARHDDVARATISIAPMEPPRPNDRTLCESVVGLGMALDGPSFFEMLGAIKRAGAELDAVEPITWLSEATNLDTISLQRAARIAGPRVERALEARQRYAEGVPAIFVNGRPFTGPVEHIAAWCRDPVALAMLNAAHTRAAPLLPSGRPHAAPSATR